MRVAALIVLLVLSVFSYPGEAFRNFASCISIQDFEVIGDTVWVASSGGIYKHCRSTGKGILLPNTSSLPDPLKTSFLYDNDKNLWTGTSMGYLEKHSQKGNVAVSRAYVSNGWSITDLATYGKYLIVGSSNGVSFFDKQNMTAIKNATRFGSSSSYAVNKLFVDKGILYVALNDGVAKLDLSTIDSVNLYESRIWKFEPAKVSVRSLLNVSDSIKKFSGPTAIFKGKVIRAVDNLFYHKDSSYIEFPSEITTLKSNGNELWIGTKENSFCRWDGTNYQWYVIPGMTVSNINRVFVDHSSNLWVIPRVSGASTPWWRAIMSLQDGIWKRFNYHTYAGIGIFGENPDFYGVTESYTPNGNFGEWRMWFGTSGGGIKNFNPTFNSWIQFTVTEQSDGNAKFSPFYLNWAKNDALVQDNNGYLWISAWRNTESKLLHNALLCYDPNQIPDPEQSNPLKAHYRWFFPAGDNYHANNYTVLSLDSNKCIIAGSEDGKVIVFKPAANPLKDSVQPVASYTRGENEFGESEPIGSVVDIISTADGITRIVTNNGIYKYNPDDNRTLEKEEFGTGVRAIEAEDPYILWLGVPSEGLVRYDVKTGERSVFGLAHGLVSNNITDLALDRKNGIIWVATENGISRFSIGYKLDGGNKKETVLVYPNPFSKKRHSTMFFKNLPSLSKVDIFDLSGKRISNAKEMRLGSDGSYFTWNPSNSIVPGTYFYVIHNEDFSKSGKFLITP